MSCRVLFATALLAGLTSTISTAAPITGTFNIAGSITVTTQTISWTLDSAPFTPNKATLAGGGTGSFAGLGGTLVTIGSLDRTLQPTGVQFAPLTFITFDGAPSFPTLDINFIFPGIYSSAACLAAPAVGQQCTVTPDSPFSFVNNPPPPPIGPDASASFVFQGVTSDGLENWRGIFTSQFTVPYQAVLASLAANGSVTNTFSATFTVVPNPNVPEASSVSLLGLGLGLIGLSTKLRRFGKRA
jgi:hypothetical protein